MTRPPTHERRGAVSAPEPAPAADETAGLGDHGDRQVPPGAVDLAVNVLPTMPGWLRDDLAAVDLAGYPDTAAARSAAAARHGLDPAQCLLTNGAAEAFWAVAHGLRPRLAACVHPSFTAPEAALRAAAVPVARVVRRPEDGFALHPSDVPEEADLVVLGRPDNPTGRLEPVEVLTALVRPGRTVVVDEAFADFLPADTTVAALGLPGVLCVRSLTKLWGIAGLRTGYVLGDPALLSRLGSALQPWPVNSLAARAVERLSAREEERRERAQAVAAAREELVGALGPLTGVRLWASPANFLLLRLPAAGGREALLGRGLAVRRCDTFPGLDDTYVRIAVHPDPDVRRALVGALAEVLTGMPAG
ncbi:aminotransferase class I/II-fold pyridoxal phosphate-dependent enzyme [Nocardioides sp. SYSU DS0663]|uniref:aminotransferase class I/II-fold pyridoxal phosphate-dependent enzyme n=1 Tax=Nocardioides sp. SYSU DS0663 TaxID=3416445 RepID=UPI003F4B1516